MDGLLDKTVEEMARKVVAESKATMLPMLNEYLFKKYCEKGYLSECEPFYCTYRYTNNCRYIQALRELHETYGIDIAKG